MSTVVFKRERRLEAKKRNWDSDRASLDDLCVKRAVCVRVCKESGCGILLGYDFSCLVDNSRPLTPRINE